MLSRGMINFSLPFFLSFTSVLQKTCCEKDQKRKNKKIKLSPSRDIAQWGCYLSAPKAREELR